MFWGEDVTTGAKATYQVPARTVGPLLIVFVSGLVNATLVGIPTILHLAGGGGDCSGLGSVTLVGWCESGAPGNQDQQTNEPTNAT